MTDWLGHLIANWPMWLVIITLVVVGVGWFFMNALEWGPFNTARRHEWPEDKKKRLAKEKLRKQKIQDFTKNLKLKKG